MKRILVLAGLLFLGISLWSSTASAGYVLWQSSVGYIDDPQKAHDYVDQNAPYYGVPMYYDGYRNIYIWQGDCPASPKPGNYLVDPNGCVEEEPTPEICEEQNKLFDSSTGSCVDECTTMELDGICLSQAPVGEPDQSDDGGDCSPNSDDFKGIAFGKPYCDSNLPEAPTCPEGQMNYIGGPESGGFACGEAIESPNDAGESETEETTTTTDGNGNTTTTTTDEDGNTTTTTDDGAGNSTTINNYPGTDSETGEPCTASSVACHPTPDTEKGFCADGGSLCDDVNDIKKTLDHKSDRTDKDGSFSDPEADGEITAAEGELTTGINTIKTEIGTYFDLSLTGAEITCGPGVDVLGVNLQICPSAMKEELAVIAQIVMLMAGLISLMIIMR